MKNQLLFGAAAAVAATALSATIAPSAKAACIDPASVCAQFVVTSPSTPTSVSVVTPPNSATAPNPASAGGTNGLWTHATVVFSVSGLTAPGPFQLTGVSLEGDGITGSLNLGSTNTFNSDGSIFISGANIGLTALTTSIATVNWANTRITFTIPQGLNPGAVITALVNYTNTGTNNTGDNSSSGLFTTTAVSPPVPGPLPLLGAGAAFGFSRQIRRRVKVAA